MEACAEALVVRKTQLNKLRDADSHDPAAGREMACTAERVLLARLSFDARLVVERRRSWRLLAPADKEPVESVMAGLKAHAQPDDAGADHPPDGNLPVILVLERSVLSMETEESEAVRLLPKVPPVEKPKRPRIWSA